MTDLSIFATASHDNSFSYEKGIFKKYRSNVLDNSFNDTETYSSNINTTGLFNLAYRLNGNHKISYNSLFVNKTILHNFRIFELLKKIISISLALILITSNVGFTLGTHICGGFAVINELMIGHNNLDCGMGDMDTKNKMSTADTGTHFESVPCWENEFKKTDCLDCGNCCKTTSPIFTDKDIERISKYVW